MRKKTEKIEHSKDESNGNYIDFPKMFFGFFFNS